MERRHRKLAFMERQNWNNNIPLPLQTLIEVAGNRRVLIENHRGITEYSKQLIGVKASFGIVNITGRGLRILQMTREKLVIGGYIFGLLLANGDPL